ncbi:MAG: hypothetical protein F6K21_03105 [Symploca sp. SIO2D2]|nr:hypothetical protein [Symploca sp. SIO2D2]NET62773.1 hypothetical protein [Symploca sp. SIO2E6]
MTTVRLWKAEDADTEPARTNRNPKLPSQNLDLVSDLKQQPSCSNPSNMTLPGLRKLVSLVPGLIERNTEMLKNKESAIAQIEPDNLEEVKND